MLSVLPDYVYGAVLPGLQKDGREVVFAPNPDRSLVRKSISAAGLPKDTKVLKFKDGSMLNGVVLCGLEVDKYYENVPKDLLERAKGDCRVRRYSSMYGRRNLDEWLRPRGYLAKADEFGVQYALANAGFPAERVGCLWGNDGVLYVNDINTYVMLQSGIGAIVWEGSRPVSEFLRTNTYVTVDGVDDMVKRLSGDQLSVAGLYAFEWDGAKLEPHVVDGETFVHYLEANGFPVLPANEWMPFSEAVAALNKSKEEVEKFLKRVEEEGITASRNEGGTRWVSKDAVKSYADVASKGIRAAIREASRRAGEFVEMAQSVQDADERVKAAEKKASEAEKRASEAEKKASEAEKKASEAETKLADFAGEVGAKLADAEKRVSEAEAKLADACRKRVEAEETARGYSRQLDSLRAENESYCSEVANWKKRAEGLEKEKSGWKKSRAASSEEVTALQTQVAELSGQLDDAKTKLKSGSRDYAKLYTENRDNKRALEEMKGKLGILQTSSGSFEKRRVEYESTIADLKGKVAEANKERDAVERKFGALQRKHGNLVKSNDRVLKENAELSERVSALRRNVESLQCSLGDVQTPALSGPVRYGFGGDCDFEAVIVNSDTIAVVMSPEMASALEVLGM